MKTGVILNNIGSPDNSDTKSVRRYLREFLMDPGVIELPYFFRFILVYLIITPFRAPKSAEKYQKIWTAKGSPLVWLTESIAKKIQKNGSDLAVETGMQFQNPSMDLAISNLVTLNPDLEKIYLIPMYPQYSLATTAAGISKFKKQWQNYKKNYIGRKLPEIFAMKPFYDSDFFIDRVAEKIKFFELKEYDAILFSYHGLPVANIMKNEHCQLNGLCCESGMKFNCYRSQCLATTKAVLKKLGSSIESLTTFQSRLGRGEWIQPYTDQTLIKLAQGNTKKILVVCPAFTVDCLETLEEIQIENRNLFLNAGGSRFDYVPCLNDDEVWCRELYSVIISGKHFDRL